MTNFSQPPYHPSITSIFEDQLQTKYPDLFCSINSNLELVKTGLVEKLHLCSNSLDHNYINDHLHKLLRSSAKHLRPLLIIISCELLNYRKHQHILLGVIAEYIHCASLIHDDVVDQGIIRRGMDSTNLTLGNKKAVLVGDLLYSIACELISTTQDYRYLQIFANAIKMMANAELSQLHSNNTIISEQKYYQILFGKTASLIAACTTSCGILSDNLHQKNNYPGTSHRFSVMIDSYLIPKYLQQPDFSSTSKILWQYGYLLGIAFQIIDDYLDYFGESKNLGKQCFSDLRHGKPTLGLIYAYQLSDYNQKKQIKNIIENPCPSESKFELNIKFISELFDKFQIKKKCIEKAQLFTNEACKTIEDNFPSSPAKDILILLTNRLLNRIN